MMITTQPPRCQTLTDLHAYLKLLCLWPQVFFITQPPTPSQTKNDLNINFKKNIYNSNNIKYGNNYFKIKLLVDSVM